jgi:hypothetical protein
MPRPFQPDHLLILEEARIWHPFRAWHNPDSVSASSAAFLRDSDEVLAVESSGTARAYPLRLMAAHHIVHDQIDGRHIVVTF